MHCFWIDHTGYQEHCSDNETTSTPTSKATTTNADASTTVTTQPRPDNNYPDKPSQPDNNYPDKPQPDNENPEYPENPADAEEEANKTTQMKHYRAGPNQPKNKA